MGHRVLDIKLVAGQGVSPLCAANDQALGALCTVTIPSIPESSSQSDSFQGEESHAEEEDNTEVGRSEIKTSSDKQDVSEGEDKQECPHTQDTPTSVSQLFGEHEDTDPKSDSGDKVQATRQRQHKNSPQEGSPKKDSSGSSSSEEEPPTDKVLHDEARQKAWLLDTCFDAWHHDKIANNVAS